MDWGVPQGSVLGPFLFLISINDLPFSVQAKTILYADDTTLFNVANSINELQQISRVAFDEASTWFKANGFLLNEEKTQNVIFSLKSREGENLNPSLVDSVKFLGVYVDSRLSWSPHIDFILKKLSKVIFLLRRLLLFVSPTYVRTAYFAYFQSILRYGLIFWGNCSRINEVLVIQKKSIRVITKSKPLDHCKPLFTELKIQTVINLYIFDLTLYVLDNADSLKFNNNKHNYNTRGSVKVSINYCRLTKTIDSHTVVSLKIYNKLLHVISKYSPREFKNKFFNWLIQHPFYSVEEFLSYVNIDF